MAWSVLDTPYEKSILFQDGLQRHCTSTTAPLFHESQPGSGNFDLPVNMSLEAKGGVRELKSGQYNLKVTPDTGLVVFEKSNQAINNELVDFGYIDPLNQWVSVGDTAHWDSERITYTDGNMVLGPDGGVVEICVQTITKWVNVWPEIDVTNRSTNAQSKTEIYLSENARAKIEANIPTLWNERLSYVAALYRLGNDIPLFFIDNARKNPDLGLGFELGERNKAIELRTAGGETLATMPLDVAYCGVSEKRKRGDEPQEIALSKRIFKGTDGYYLAVGMTFEQFRKAKAGAIIYDPSYQVGSSSDDGYMQGSAAGSERATSNSGTMNLTNVLRGGYHPSQNEDWSDLMRFTGIAVPKDTIPDSATLGICGTDTFVSGGTFYHVSAVAADNAGTLTTTAGNGGPTARPRTTANDGTWDATSQTLNVYSTRTVINTSAEVFARAGWVSGNAIMFVLDTYKGNQTGGSFDYNEWKSQNSDAANAPTYSVTYTANPFPAVAKPTLFFYMARI